MEFSLAENPMLGSARAPAPRRTSDGLTRSVKLSSTAPLLALDALNANLACTPRV